MGRFTLMFCLLCIQISGLLAIWKGRKIITRIPYQVAIVKSGYYICGGSIISPHLILTAAYPVANSLPEKLVIKAGSNYLKGELAKIHHGVKEIQIHHKYDETNRLYDVAILVLHEKLHYDDNLGPIPLIGRAQQHSPNTRLIVRGWGDSEIPTRSLNLKEAKVHILYNEECFSYYELHGRMYNKDVLFCAGGSLKGSNICYRDAGSPIVDVDGKLVGVTSLDSTCGTGAPGYYTKISLPEIWDWIDMSVALKDNEITVLKIM